MKGVTSISRLTSFIVIFLCILSNIQCIKEYYVSPTGTEGDCTQSAPCSLSYAISEASIEAYTTTTYIYLLSGLYQQNNDIIIKNFKEIKISAETENSLVNLSTNSSNSSVFSVNNSLITFEYLIFDSSISTPLIADENSYLIINSCSFTNNTNPFTNSFGGAVIYSLSPLEINYSKFSKNFLGNRSICSYSQTDYLPNILQGGVVFGNASIIMMGSSFKDNYICCSSLNEVNGGIIYAKDFIQMEHSSFIQNIIEGEINSVYGGSIYSENSLTILNSTFDQSHINIVIHNFERFPLLIGKGGSIYAKGKIIIEFTLIRQSTIELSGYIGLARAEGGAIYGEDQISISDSTFQSNYISIDCSVSINNENYNAIGYGGAISSSSNMKIEIFRSSFAQNRILIALTVHNNPRYVNIGGGALQFNVGDIINSTFIGNSVGGNFVIDPSIESSLTGGAIECNIVNIENSLFNENNAYSTGGAIQIWNSFFNLPSKIFNSNFTSNSAMGNQNIIGGSAGGAIASVDHNNTDTILLFLQYCNFTDNLSIHGDDIYVENIGYEIIDSGSYHIHTVDSIFYNPSTSVSNSPSFSITPSPSASISPSYSINIEKSNNNNNNNNNNDSNLISIMSISSILGVFIIVVLIAGAFAALSIYKIRQQNKKIANRMIGDNYIDDHEL